MRVILRVLCFQTGNYCFSPPNAEPFPASRPDVIKSERYDDKTTRKGDRRSDESGRRRRIRRATKRVKRRGKTGNFYERTVIFSKNRKNNKKILLKYYKSGVEVK